MESYCYLRNVQDFLADGKLHMNEDLGNSLKRPIIPSGALVEYLPNSERQSENSSIRKENITRNLSRICFGRGWNL